MYSVVQCLAVVPPPVGEVTCDSDYLFGSVCTLTCQEGYTVTGENSTEFLVNGTWSNTLNCYGN